MLFAVDASNDKGTLYTLDPATGIATLLGTPGSVKFVDANGNAVDLPDPATTRYDLDVNPVADKVRVIIVERTELPHRSRHRPAYRR